MIFDKDVLKISDSIGSFIEYWGFRKIDGRIWVLIYLSEGPIDAQVLIKNLNVSKGLISTSLKTLIDYQLIEEIDFGNNRSKFYRAHCDPMGAILRVLRIREKIIVDTIQNDFNSMRGDYPNINSARMKALGKLIKSGNSFLSQILRFKKLIQK